MRRAVWFAALIVVVIAGAAALRLPRLANRPMHCDEANHADKFRLLLEHAEYKYNPYEYHGPSLNFLTLPIARLAGAEKLTELSETHLRLVPAIFGILLVGLVWLLRQELGYAAAFWAALLTAVSPAMVFFSRYYIQEMLLVCFTFGAIVALWRYTKKGSGLFSPRKGFLTSSCWLVTLGLCIGMMHASKETCVIPLFAIALAGALTLGGLRKMGWKRILLGVAAVAVIAASVSALFFSSFLANPPGVEGSYTTYYHYFGRASGEGTAGRHVYPWYYYLHLMFWYRRGDGPLWTEASIAALALMGLVAAAWGKGLKSDLLPMARFLAIYTLLMTLVYSALPYKTPWCALGFLHGMILLAGVGAAVLIRLMPHWALKAAVALLVLAATAHLGWQAWRASFVAYEDPNNPYVYAHTTHDLLRLVQRIEQIAAVHPDGKAMHVQVICPQGDYWPLPWYLRRFPRVGYFDKVPRSLPAPLIITQPQMKAQVLDYAYTAPPPGERPMYDQLLPKQANRDWQLRPYVPLHVYLHRDLLMAADRAEQSPR